MKHIFMQSDLKALRITEEDLERITGKDISPIFIGSVYRITRLTNPKFLSYFCLSQAITLLFTWILGLPIAIFLYQGLDKSADSPQSSLEFFAVLCAIALFLFVSWNILIWTGSKKLVSLSHLLDEVDKYNQVVVAVDICDHLKAVGNQRANLLDRQDVIKALEVTRDSLICGLTTERILRKNKHFLRHHQELFSSIEQNLATLKTLEIQNQAAHYNILLSEALEIGMSVQNEMLNLQR